MEKMILSSARIKSNQFDLIRISKASSRRPLSSLFESRKREASIQQQTAFVFTCEVIAGRINLEDISIDAQDDSQAESHFTVEKELASNARKGGRPCDYEWSESDIFADTLMANWFGSVFNVVMCRKRLSSPRCRSELIDSA